MSRLLFGASDVDQRFPTDQVSSPPSSILGDVTPERGVDETGIGEDADPSTHIIESLIDDPLVGQTSPTAIPPTPQVIAELCEQVSSLNPEDIVALTEFMRQREISSSDLAAGSTTSAHNSLNPDREGDAARNSPSSIVNPRTGYESPGRKPLRPFVT